jgi:hypothetical protein
MCKSPNVLNGTGMAYGTGVASPMKRPASVNSLSTLSEDEPWKEGDSVDEPGPDLDGLAARRPPSGIFSGAGDSGVWPGQPVQGAIAFITPMTMLYILIWYISGAFTNSSSKQTLQNFDKNFLSLTLMQHASAAICGGFAIRVLQLRWGRLSEVRASTAAPWRHRAFARVGGLRRGGGEGH